MSKHEAFGKVDEGPIGRPFTLKFMPLREVRQMENGMCSIISLQTHPASPNVLLCYFLSPPNFGLKMLEQIRQKIVSPRASLKFT